MKNEEIHEGLRSGKRRIFDQIFPRFSKIRYGFFVETQNAVEVDSID